MSFFFCQVRMKGGPRFRRFYGGVAPWRFSVGGPHSFFDGVTVSPRLAWYRYRLPCPVSGGVESLSLLFFVAHTRRPPCAHGGRAGCHCYRVITSYSPPVLRCFELHPNFGNTLYGNTIYYVVIVYSNTWSLSGTHFAVVKRGQGQKSRGIVHEQVNYCCKSYFRVCVYCTESYELTAADVFLFFFFSE